MSCRPVGAPTSVEEMIERAPHHIYVQVRTEVFFFPEKMLGTDMGKPPQSYGPGKDRWPQQENVLVDHGPVLFASYWGHLLSPQCIS